ncbi:MAG: ATP-binding protein [Candidatus Hatepunaea meridiana]|nr:ATP-binding protein [Candidatus Hatepunaea meridiana]
MNEQIQPLQLMSHTLDSLCDELVSGRPILISNEGKTFQFESPQTRSTFNWYLRNREKWGGQNRIKDVEAIVDQLNEEPPIRQTTAGTKSVNKTKIVHLKSIRVHRFAGIHKYGTPDGPPDDFVFNFDKPLTIIEGSNGSGKTSILSAISWCLTGFIYRSQRVPEDANQRVELGILKTSEEDLDEPIIPDMAPITPLPSAELLEGLDNTPLYLDTWVELSLQDDKGNDIGTIRRALKRSSRGKIEIEKPNLSGYGLDPLAWEIGTKMPGIIPYIRLGEHSDFSKAVSELTGLKPLGLVAEHARKSCVKLKTDLVKDREKEIKVLDESYQKIHEQLQTLIRDNTEIDPKQDIPLPSSDKIVEETLNSLMDHFDKLLTNAYDDSKLILGDSFNPSNPESRNDLKGKVGPALGQIAPDSIARLKSSQRLHNLANLKDEDICNTEALLLKLKTQAEELVGLSEKPDVASRLRLYARVSGWLKELPEHFRDIGKCPICKSVIEGKVDDITGEKIEDHIQKYLGQETDYLEKTIRIWNQAVNGSLESELPAALKGELNSDLPYTPFDLIERALSKELFASPYFKGSLSPLMQAMAETCVRIKGNMPQFSEPDIPSLPDCFKSLEDSVETKFRRIYRAIAFAKWRKLNSKPCKNAFEMIIGYSGKEGDNTKNNEDSTSDWTLNERLSALNDMVINATPLNEALKKVDDLIRCIVARREKEERIRKYGKTAIAVEPLTKLIDLVDIQVGQLMRDLSSSMKVWRQRLYRPAFVGAPEVIEADIDEDSNLIMEAEANGTIVKAQHVSNVSDLRANLLAFLLAFWQHTLRTRGGLSLLLLDDIQELFDERNRERIAVSVPRMIENNEHIILVTNNRHFRGDITRSISQESSRDKLNHRIIHTLNNERHCLKLGVFVEEIDKKRKAFEDNENVHQPARDYVKDLRIYLEQRMIDFCGTIDSDLPHDPTLSDLINYVRRLRRKGNEPFINLTFRNLVNAPLMLPNSPFLTLMNKCHHGQEGDIEYGEVFDIKDNWRQATDLIDAAHEDYDRWMRRDVGKKVSEKPPMPSPISFPSVSVPLIEDLAAFTAGDYYSEVGESEKIVLLDRFTNESIYYINTHNLGFSASIGYRVIVNLSDEEVPDNSLVIALHKDSVYARRLLRSDSFAGILALGSESENPTKRPRSLLLPLEEVQLLKINGVLFDDQPVYSKSTDEAELLSGYSLLDKVELMFKVTGDSALPLALPNQIILGGRAILPNELSTMKDVLVAIATSNGQFFKRVGDSVPGKSYLRLFESIGGIGDSIMVHTEDVENGEYNEIPQLIHARQILGVLYDVLNI